MRSYFWKTVICLTPVLLAGWVTWVAWNRYQNGEPGGFKLGVDLSGGTILVYEIDTRKQQQRAGDDESSIYDPERDTNLLAEALKRRIDPTATYNIVIRPAGGGGRVEIILPTGGEQRARKAQDEWDRLLTEMRKEYDLQELEVGRGRVQDLVERIQTQVAERVWRTRIFSNPETWKGLIDKAQDRWLQLKTRTDPASLASLVGLAATPAAAPPFALPVYARGTELRSIDARLHALKPGQVPEFISMVSQELETVLPEGAVPAWIKEQAWDRLLREVTARFLVPVQAKADEKQKGERQEQIQRVLKELKTIPPDSFEELIGRVEAKGNLLAQSALATLRPLLGPQPVQSGLLDRQKITDFVAENYGPSPRSIEARIAATDVEIGRGKDLSVEEVQRIKELVARVGSLEFKILANEYDDKAAIEDAKKYFTNTINKDDVDRAAVRGEPPLGPLETGSKSRLKQYTLDLPNKNKSTVTYSWVELGPQERRDLGLDNAARNDAESRRKRIWLEAQKHLNREAFQIPEPTSSDGRKLLHGALFFAREVKDRNMPEEQKRKKQYEYFVLARNPEIDPQTGKETPKIDGHYLVSAVSQATDGRPAVHFVFNTAGGDLFGTLTRKNVPSGPGTEENQIRRHLAIILDGLVMSAPTVNSEIRQHGQISGSFTRKEVDNLVNILRSGALPATLKPQPVSETTIGATLGRDTIDAGVTAVVAAFIAIMAFMILYYRFAGLVASLALLANLLLTIGFMVAVQATFTLPGLAGLVLMLGMAVDANVLIYERFREERERGASVALAIRNGYDRALPTIIDTHLSSIFTAIVLYIVGNDQLKGFGVSLTAGLIISLFTSLYMTRVIFDYWLARGWLHRLSMARFFSRPNFDFMGVRYFWFAATVMVTVFGAAVFIARLPNDLNIDFVGGTAYGGQLVEGKAKTIEGMRDLLNEERQNELLDVASVRQLDAEGRQFEIEYATEAGEGNKVRTVLLANQAQGDSNQEREQNIQERASVLPDWSVEQIFPSFAKEEDPETSRFFTVRTSERETDLVQAALGRLLREQVDGHWTTLQKKMELDFNPDQLAARGKETRLTFTDSATKEPEYASPSFVQSLLTRALEKEFGVKDKTGLPFIFELSGVGRSQEGRFQQLRLAFTPDLKPAQVAKVTTALQKTEREFEARPQPERLENFDSELAAATRMRALWAIIASWGAILVYLWFRFGNWTFGLAAVLCLVHDLCFTLGIVAFCHYLYGTVFGNWFLLEDFKLDLTAVAGLLTLIGYSVNDTIVVFDRIREVRGKNPELTPDMINDSVNQTLSRTLITAVSTFLVVIVLYIWGGPGVHLFAFIMVVGVIVGCYSSIYVASPLLLIFGEGVRSPGVRERQPAAAATRG